MVIASPWLYGAVQAGTILWLLVGAAAALVCCILTHAINRNTPTKIPLAVLPLLGGMALGLLQILPASDPVQSALSPVGSELHRTLDAPPPSAEAIDSISSSHQTISLNPASTRHDLALLALAATAFVLGAYYINTRRIQLWFLAVVAANGALLAMFGIVQQLSYNGQLFWVRTLADGGRPFASFVNRNNAGGYLNLCLAAAIGLTVWATMRGRAARAMGDKSARNGQATHTTRWRQSFIHAMGQLDTPTVASLGLVCMLIAGVLCTFSRGAGLAMAIAILTAACVLVLNQKNARTTLVWIAVVVVGAFFLVGWVGYRQTVQSRYAELLDGATIASDSRLAHWADSVRAVPDFWRVGSGLGTYRYVYPRYQSRLNEKWFYHAENQYLEALVEGGTVALGLLVGTIVMLGLACRRLLRAPSNSQTIAIGAMGVFALASQVIHAFFDFGLHIPANLFLFALLCGSVAGTVKPPSRTRGVNHSPATNAFRFLPASVFALLLVATILGGLEMRNVAEMEKCTNESRFEGPLQAANESQLRGAIVNLENALARRPDDAPGQFRAGLLYTQLFRITLGQRLEQGSRFAWNETLLWDATAPTVLHAQAHLQHRATVSPHADTLGNDPLVRRYLAGAQNHFLLARRACPVMPQVHLRLAELFFLSGEPPTDSPHLQRAATLAPADADFLFGCGLLDYQAARPGTAFAVWKRSLSLTPRHLNEIVRLTRGKLSTAELIASVVPPSAEVLTKLAEDHFASEGSAAERLLIARNAEALLDDSQRDHPETLRLRARIRVLQSRYAEAITDYKNAVLLQSHNVELRYDLARLLAEDGDRKEARRHAEICAYLAPRNQRYLSLLNSLSSR